MMDTDLEGEPVVVAGLSNEHRGQHSGVPQLTQDLLIIELTRLLRKSSSHIINMDIKSTCLLTKSTSHIINKLTGFLRKSTSNVECLSTILQTCLLIKSTYHIINKEYRVLVIK